MQFKAGYFLNISQQLRKSLWEKAGKILQENKKWVSFEDAKSQKRNNLTELIMSLLKNMYHCLSY